MDLFRMGGLNLTAFSMIDYKNVHAMSFWSDHLQMNAPLNKLSVSLNPMSDHICHTLNKTKQIINISYLLKFRGALLIDALIVFNRQINHLIGRNMNKLFGFDGISLKNSEILINKKRGINCTLNSSLIETWPLGKFVMKNLINVFVCLK